jgi:hypothetical protein
MNIFNHFNKLSFFVKTFILEETHTKTQRYKDHEEGNWGYCLQAKHKLHDKLTNKNPSLLFVIFSFSVSLCEVFAKIFSTCQFSINYCILLT